MPLAFQLKPLPLEHLERANEQVADLPLLVLVLPADPVEDELLVRIDRLVHGTLLRALRRRDFRGGRDECLWLVGEERGVQRVLLVGRGGGVPTRTSMRRAAAVAVRQANKVGISSVQVMAMPSDLAIDPALLEGVVIGAAAGAWHYADLQSLPPEAQRRARVESIDIMAAVTPAHQAAFDAGVAIAEGQALAKRLGQMPGNVCTPDTFADVAHEIAGRHGMTCTVLGREEMRTLGMGSFLAVAQGTPQEPRLVTLEYRGGAADQAPVVLIGKGLCFDSGGISIKPAADMEWMKFDMSGAGGVLGAMEAIGRLRLPVNVVGMLGATTNMPSGTAVNPGDVVRASNGKTIEIINTDAEGRLVLADLLVYAKRFNPAVAIDAATLTGAIVIGLGHQAVGVFGSEQSVVDAVLAAGQAAGEPGWALPMWEEYREQIKSDVADMKNTGGRAGGSITAALFLQEFVDNFPWVHLDIAGTAYSQSDLGWIPRGPTGVPVGTFVEFVRARVRG
jgi:leucyl aminopeptidase